MHKLSRLTPYKRQEIYRKYKEKMRSTKWECKETFYEEQWKYYKVHVNTIRKICKRWKNNDFEDHKSTTVKNQWHNFKKYCKLEKKLYKKLQKEKETRRYEKEMAWELVHIDVHKLKNIKGENPKKKKYLAGMIDDATRTQYLEKLPDKKAKTLAWFLKRWHVWFKNKGITIKKIMSDNGKEFTTHHISSRKYHSFEIMLNILNIVHKYTRIYHPQTNGKIERFWRIFNEDFFFKYTFTSWKDLNMKMKDWIVYYNTKRKHWWIWYIPPLQKLENLLAQNKVCI